MKIHDYGLWHYDITDEIWRKSPVRRSRIYFDGIRIGWWCREFSPWVRGEWLAQAKIKLVKNVPGESDMTCWHFPAGYVPADTDFEVL